MWMLIIHEHLIDQSPLTADDMVPVYYAMKCYTLVLSQRGAKHREFWSAILEVFFAIEYFCVEDFTAKFRTKIAPRRKKKLYGNFVSTIHVYILGCQKLFFRPPFTIIKRTTKILLKGTIYVSKWINSILIIFKKISIHLQNQELNWCLSWDAYYDQPFITFSASRGEKSFFPPILVCNS
jgi:hypothetical protein